MPSCCNDVDALVARYSRLYELGDASVVREVERSVLGCEYGGTSWTTRDEAQRIIGLLDLRASDRLLDVGAGSGWPALYVLQCSACEAVLVDLPLSAMRAALDRALEDRLADRCRVSVADAASLPFRAARWKQPTGEASRVSWIAAGTHRDAIARGIERLVAGGIFARV